MQTPHTTSQPAQQPTQRPMFRSTSTALAAAGAAIAASITTLLLALSPALLTPAVDLAAPGAQVVELPLKRTTVPREAVMDGSRVDAGHTVELPRVQIAVQRGSGGPRTALGEGMAGQAVMQRRGF